MREDIVMRDGVHVGAGGFVPSQKRRFVPMLRISKNHSFLKIILRLGLGLRLGFRVRV